MTQRTDRSLRRLAMGAALTMVLMSCGGSDNDSGVSSAPPSDAAATTDGEPTASVDDDPDSMVDEDPATSDDSPDTTDATDTTDPTPSPDESDEIPSGVTSFIEIDGDVTEFDNAVFCAFGDGFWGPDFRRIELDSGGDFPGLSVGYAPSKAGSEDVLDPNGVDFFPTVGSWWYSSDASSVDDVDLTLVADGIAGSATLGVFGEDGPDGEVFATFAVSCAGADDDVIVYNIDSNDDDSEQATDEDAAAPDVDTGTVVLAGETYELTGPSRSQAIIESDPDEDLSGRTFDFEICETVNPAFAGDFNIVGTLGDETEFQLSGNVDEPFDEFDGLFIGEIFDEERATDLSVSLDGRTLSGSAVTGAGDIEFTFTC